MRQKTRSLLTLLLAIVLTVSGTFMVVAATATADDFKVIVNTDKDSYDSGEKIYMSIGIENNSADADVTNVALSYDIPDDITDHIVDYDKLPTSLESLDAGANTFFATEKESPDTGDSNMVVIFAGIMLVAAGIIIAVKAGCLKKLVSLFMVIAMVAGINAVSFVEAKAEGTTLGVLGSKTVTYAGEEKNIVVKAVITVDGIEDSGEDSGEEIAVSGTDLAKLLLANGRLDSEELTKENEIIVASNIFEGMNELRIMTLSTSDTSQYADNSNMMEYFDSYIMAITDVTSQAADTIDYVKESINVTGVWVEYGAVGGEILLEVTDNAEWLFVNGELSTYVCRRYTDSNGDDVYEIYQEEKEDGSYSYLLCTPDKRYEYSVHVPMEDGDFDNYVVVENSRGYWNMFTASPVENRFNVQNLVSASEFAYVYYGEIYDAAEGGYKSLDHTIFIDPTLSCDLISISGDHMEVMLVGFEGIESLEYDDDNFITSFTTVGGEVIEAGTEIAEGIFYDYGAIAYSETPYATLSFYIQGEDGNWVNMNNETASTIIDALAEYGIVCKYDLSAVLTGVDNSFLIADNFGKYYSWNGYYVTDYEATQSAIDAGKNKHAELMAGYDEVKDAEKVEVTPSGIVYDDYDFAELTLLSAEAVTLADNVVSIENLQVEVSVSDVMMDGEMYEIQYALVELGENEGEYGSAILLTTESSGADSYAGSDLALTKSAEFTIPSSAVAGEYTVSAYVATSEGIRVSQMVPLTFTSEASYTNVENGYKIDIQLNDADEATIYYTLMNEYQVTMPAAQESYLYEEVYQFLSEEVMKYGYPMDSAELEVYDLETGEAVEASEGDTLSGCVCKLQYDVPNVAVMTGYVYVELP